jgi:spermidine synthase
VKPWELIDTAVISDHGGEIRLHRRDTEFSIRVPGYELMNSRMHGSEEDLARITIERLPNQSTPRILIGGLGMGFTVAGALEVLPPEGQIEVVELVPAVIDWNRRFLSHVAGDPLADPRVTVSAGDVAHPLRTRKDAFDAIILDVDNGPEGLTRKANNRLYSLSGLNLTRAALRPGGIFAVWSAGPDPEFTTRLRRAKFWTEEFKIRPRHQKGGTKHTIWIAQRRSTEADTFLPTL